MISDSAAPSGRRGKSNGISSIVGAATALAGKVDTLAEASIKLGELVRRRGDRALNQQFFELQSEVNGVKEDIKELREKIESLRNTKEPGKNLKYEKSVWWEYADGKRVDGPFCPSCWEDKKKSIHLTPGATKGTYHCGVCQNSFTTSEYDPSPVRRRPFGH